jgi:hypothetical protein
MSKQAFRIGEFGLLLPVMCLVLHGIALGQENSARFLYGEGTPRFLTLPANFSSQQAALPATTSLPVWTGSFNSAGTTYSYTMVGTDPALGSATTTTPVIIVPLRFVFHNGVVLDSTTPAFGSTQSAVQSIVQSPLFQKSAFAPGGTPVGTTQYIDAFQRANFWGQVSTTSPHYHLLLTQPFVLKSALTVNIPAGFGTTVAGPGAPVGEVSLVYFELWLNLVLAKMTSVQPNQLLVFVTYNTFFTQNGCCILGFHLATGVSPATAQTLAVAAYNDPGVFNVPIQDIHALSHEVGEWADDPFGNNPVPGWSAGQAAGTCQKNLEVGDPVTGIAFDVTMNGMTYHPEDLVFLSWFARQTPSTAVNGWYTFLNSFGSPPAVCR